MIVLKNPGLLEIDLITTMGAHVKTSGSAIGQFGTGMKYAIAVLLREQIPFDLYIGENGYEFYTETKELRGKAFELCYMRGPYDTTPLGFTTEFGKNWEPWQAYRELFTNAVLDEEGGGAYHGDKASAPQPEDGFTTFRIQGSIDTNGVFLCESGKPLIFEDDDVEIYDGMSDYLYYQGIRAKDLNKRSMYTYNIKSYCTLSEDRLISYDFQVSEKLTTAIAAMGEQHRDLVGKILNSGETYFESRLDFSEAETEPSETFIEVHEASPAVERNSTVTHLIKRYTQPAPKTHTDTRKEFIAALHSVCDDFDVSDREMEIKDGTLHLRTMAVFLGENSEK